MHMSLVHSWSLGLYPLLSKFVDATDDIAVPISKQHCKWRFVLH